MRRVLIAVAVVAVLAEAGAVVGHARGRQHTAAAMPSPGAASSRSPRPGPTTVAAAVGPGSDTSLPGTEVGTDVAAARVAGVAAVARTGEVFRAGVISRGDLIAEFATARFAPVLAERTTQQLIDLLFGLREAAGHPVEVRMVAQPVTATAAPVGPGRVGVDVWTVSVFVADGQSPPPELWATIHLDMADVDGRWLVDGWEMTAGPSPAPPPEAALASDDEVAAVLDWSPVAVGGG